MGILTQEQANFILSSRLKRETPNQVRDYSKDDGYEAFKELRWGWTGGNPMCPHCFHERLYEFADRDKFKCARCGKHFSTTTSTSFKSRKMEHKTYIHAMSFKIHEPISITELGQRIAVNYRTAWRLDKLLGLIKGNISTVRTIDRKWPYSKPSPQDDGADVLCLVNEAISKRIPEDLRADICQEIILGVLEGEITIEDVAKQANKYVSKFWQKTGWDKSLLSMDQPMFDGRSWHDVVEDRHGRMDGEIDAEWLGYDPLDHGEYGFKTQDDHDAYYASQIRNGARPIGTDRVDILEKNRDLLVRPVLNSARYGR